MLGHLLKRPQLIIACIDVYEYNDMMYSVFGTIRWYYNNTEIEYSYVNTIAVHIRVLLLQVSTSGLSAYTRMCHVC